MVRARLSLQNDEFSGKPPDVAIENTTFLVNHHTTSQVICVLMIIISSDGTSARPSPL